MEENQLKVIEWLKNQDIKGTITGSCLLGYFENSDVDCFVYDKSSFIKIYYLMAHNPMFQILDELELWKATKFEGNVDQFAKTGMLTIKYIFNTCIPVNIIYKKDYNNIFDILSNFDLDIICKGYDIQTKKYLDLTGDSTITKIADINKWNTSFYDPELWQMNRLLRQLERVFKYHSRGYNTDKVVLKYIKIIDSLQKMEDIFHSENFSEKLKLNKENTKIIKQVCLAWLENHTITDKELGLLKLKIREI
jgi:hypothetical protein